MKWIKTSARLPEDGQRVLGFAGNRVDFYIFRKSFSSTTTKNDNGIITKHREDYTNIFDVDAGCCSDYDDNLEVTYWMELPKGPSVHKYIYKLIDGAGETYEEMQKGFTDSKHEAEEWVKHGGNRAYHELLSCKVTEMKCSEHCSQEELK